MTRLVRHSLSYAPLRETAIELQRSVYAADRIDFIRSIDAFVRQRVVVISEPEELLITPERMIYDIRTRGCAYGDCDDVTMLSAALASVMGFRTRFRAVGIQPDGSYAHVYCEVEVSEQRFLPVDTTIPFYPFKGKDTLVLEV